ncbi:MAG: LuxR C-terminal-related transcriptional regulator, partial [Muribaculaceae bacterium]|nr:LuxR C-terminal-related transcriptional regulator [Muribaculaceae bacterium]
RIVNNLTGAIITLSLSDRKNHILTEREKEILLLIKEGKPSKQIADILGISVYTVSRHRQNIIEKLSVDNSVEAVMAATSMKLL